MIIRFFLILFGLSCSLNSWANTSSSQRLKQVQTEIKNVSADLSKKQENKQSLYKQLEQQSRHISSINRKLIELKKQNLNNNQQLAKLQQQQSEKQQAQQQQIKELLEQLRTAYIHTQSNYLKVLLSQHNLARLARATTYYRYFHQARQQQLEDIQQQLENLSEQQQKIFAAQQQQQVLFKQQQQQKAALKDQNERRKYTLAKIEKTINSQGAKLKSLQEEEQSLQALLTQLSQLNQTKPAVTLKPKQLTIRFSGQQGQLIWPIKGELLARYGTTRNLGKLTWKGIMIASSPGNEVNAAATGEVVFADWLRGFGLLVIIDHGQQYMTLYGNNQALLKQAGEFVSAGDVIAQSGAEGMHKHTGLYFEVRHKGSPTNPLRWLSKEVKVTN